MNIIYTRTHNTVKYICLYFAVVGLQSMMFAIIGNWNFTYNSVAEIALVLQND